MGMHAYPVFGVRGFGSVMLQVQCEDVLLYLMVFGSS